MAAGSSSAASQQTYGSYIHEFPKNLIDDEELLDRTLNEIYPEGHQLKKNHPTTAVVLCTRQEPRDLKDFLQAAGVILRAAPREG